MRITCGEFVFPQVVFVGQVDVAVNVAGVAAENKHGRLVDDGAVVVARSRQQAAGSDQGTTPRLFLRVKPEEIVEHGLAVVAAKDVERVLVGDQGVLGPSRAHKLVAVGHLAPSVNLFERTEIQRQTLLMLGPRTHDAVH